MPITARPRRPCSSLDNMAYILDNSRKLFPSVGPRDLSLIWYDTQVPNVKHPLKL